jgi:hypothetical protein
LSEQHAQRMSRLLQAGLERRHGGFGGGQDLLRLSHVQFAHESGLETGLGQVNGFGLCCDIVAGDEELLLGGAHLDIVQRHVAEQGHEHIAVVFLAGLKVVPGLFQRAAFGAKNVYFPTGIEVRVVKSTFGIRCARGKGVV